MHINEHICDSGDISSWRFCMFPTFGCKSDGVPYTTSRQHACCMTDVVYTLLLLSRQQFWGCLQNQTMMANSAVLHLLSCNSVLVVSCMAVRCCDGSCTKSCCLTDACVMHQGPKKYAVPASSGQFPAFWWGSRGRARRKKNFLGSPVGALEFPRSTPSHFWTWVI